MAWDMLHALSEFFLRGTVELGCYLVGRLVAPIISGGRWHCEPLSSRRPDQANRDPQRPEPRRKVVTPTLPRPLGRTNPRGTGRVLTSDETMALGMVTLMLFGALIALLVAVL